MKKAALECDDPEAAQAIPWTWTLPVCILQKNEPSVKAVIIDFRRRRQLCRFSALWKGANAFVYFYDPEASGRGRRTPGHDE